MKSNNLLRLVAVLFVVQVWSSEETLINDDSKKDNRLLGIEENCTPNITIKTDFYNRPCWAQIVFDGSLTGIEKIHHAPDMNQIRPSPMGVMIGNTLKLQNLRLPKQLDLQQFTKMGSLFIENCTFEDGSSEISLPKNITELAIDKSDINNIHLSDETTINTLAFYIPKNEIIEWEKIYHLPKYSVLQIVEHKFNDADGNHYPKLEGLLNIKNADNVETLELAYICISDLDLRNFHTMTHLNIYGCIFENQNSQIMIPKETKIFTHGGIFSDGKLKKDIVADHAICTYYQEVKKPEYKQSGSKSGSICSII